jgi:uncharacterized protein (UPF0371 family)
MSQLHASMYEAVIEKSGFAAWDVSVGCAGLSYCASAALAKTHERVIRRSTFRIGFSFRRLWVDRGLVNRGKILIRKQANRKVLNSASSELHIARIVVALCGGAAVTGDVNRMAPCSACVQAVKRLSSNRNTLAVECRNDGPARHLSSLCDGFS